MTFAAAGDLRPCDRRPLRGSVAALAVVSGIGALNVFEETASRMHTIKALMVATIGVRE